jgi:transposase
MMAGRSYSLEFKQEALRLVREQHLSKSQVSRDLGITTETLRRWMDEYPAPEGSSTAPPNESPAAELARLRRENELLRMERDILKKAVGICSRMPL